MINFKIWLEDNRKLAASYQNLLRNVPQDPKHHPEGDVMRHSKLVRQAVPKAINELKNLQKKHPKLSAILSNINFNLEGQEDKLIAMAA